MSVAPPVKIKKRITPTAVAPIVEEPEDNGPKGPRRNPNLLNEQKKGGKMAKRVSEILKGNPKAKPKGEITQFNYPSHTNPWVDHVKKFSEVNNLPYACALSNPEIKTQYVRGEYTNKSDLKRVASPPRAEKKEKKQKGEKDEGRVPIPRKPGGKKMTELEEHVLGLNLLGIGDQTTNLDQKRASQFDKIFEKYNKAMTDKEDKAFVAKQKALDKKEEEKRKKAEKKYKKLYRK